MRESLLNILVDPISKSSLVLMDQKLEGAEITDGVLTNGDAHSYPIRDGIPRFVRTKDAAQKQTESSFGYKWGRQDAWYSPEAFAACQPWLVERYGFESVQAMRDFFGAHRRVLDAGCGSGFSSSLWIDSSWQSDRCLITDEFLHLSFV